MVERPDSGHRRLQAAVKGRQTKKSESQLRIAERQAMQAILEIQEFRDTARLIFDSCKNTIGATAGYVALLSKDGTLNEVQFLDAGGLPCTVDSALPMPIRGLRGEAYRNNKAVYQNDFSKSEWVKFMPEGHVELDNVLFAPLKIEGKAVGLLGLANKQCGFTENDVRIATSFGELAAIALLNSRTLESLKHSEEQLSSVAQTAVDAIISINSRGNIILWNTATEYIFGYPAEEVMGKPLTFIMPERFREAHINGMGGFVSTGKSNIIGKTVEVVGLKKDGSEFPVELSLADWKTNEGVFFTGIIRDITERKKAEEALQKARDELEIRVQERTEELAKANKALQAEIAERTWAEEELRRLNRAHKTLSKCNQAIIRAHEEAELLHQVCRVITEAGGYRLAWVGFAEQDEQKAVRPVAQAGYEEGYLETVKITWADSERGRGPTGTAIRTGKYCVAKNILTDPSYIPWRSEAIKRGYASSIALPLIAYGNTFGALNIYAKEADAFDEDEIALLTELADDLAYGIMSLRTAAERKHAEEALRQSEEKYRALMINASDGIMLIDKGGRILEVNKEALELLGYPKEEVFNAHFIRFIPEEELEKTVAAFKETAMNGSGSLLDGGLLRKDGKTVPVDITASVIEYTGKQGIQAIFRDITERKRVEEITKESEEKFRNLVEWSLAGVYIIQDGKFPYVNPKLAEIFGYTQDEIISSKSVSDLVAKYDRVLVAENIYKRLQGEVQSIYYTFRGQRKDGELIDVEVYGTKIEYKGKPAVIGTLLDITERKIAEAMRLENLRLEAADKAKSEFLASMSHELRTPLNAILGFSELLKQNIAGELNEKQKRYVEDILTSGNHLLALINDILDLSKVEAGKIELVIEKLSVPQAINEGLTLVKEKAMRHNVKLKTELDPELKFIEADRLRFKQILFNLLSNAVKFSKPEGGVVTVRTKKEEDMAKISVSDTGIGIKKEDLGKLFKEFEQVSTGIARKYGGTGLGLAISKKLVELHGGKIRAESKFGEGSTFTFLLPLKAKMEANK